MNTLLDIIESSLSLFKICIQHHLTLWDETILDKVLSFEETLIGLNWPFYLRSVLQGLWNMNHDLFKLN